jgi:FK506-binding protein 2
MHALTLFPAIFKSFVVGVGQVIKGWDEGLVGMCLNEKRTLTIPADMAYGQSPLSIHHFTFPFSQPPGSRGFGSVIPANSALVFTVELVGLDSKVSSHEEL